jgi:hypothetical protein
MASSVKRGSFYVTCTSSKSRDFFPDNKTSSFTTRLPDPIHLDNADRRWEVGVSSFTYSQAINNFGEGSLIEFYLYDGFLIHQIKVVDQHVTSVHEVVNAMNDAIISYADAWNAKALAKDREAMLFQRAQNNRHRSSKRAKRDDQTSQSENSAKQTSGSSLQYEGEEESERKRVKRTPEPSTIAWGTITASVQDATPDDKDKDGDSSSLTASGKIGTHLTLTLDPVKIPITKPEGTGQTGKDEQKPTASEDETDDGDNEDDDDDDDDDTGESETHRDAKTVDQRKDASKKRALLLDQINGIRFSAKNMYGIPRVTNLTAAVLDEAVDMGYPYGVVVEAAFIRFYVSDGKIDLSLGLPHYDIAFSPNLLKMLGFQEYHIRFSLDRMKKRVALRSLVFGLSLNDTNKLKMLKSEIGEEKEHKGVDVFSDKGVVYRHQLYERHGFPVARFNAFLARKSKGKGHKSIADTIKLDFVAEQEYVNLARNVFHSDSFSFMDYAVHTLMTELPFDTIVYGSRYTTLVPTDMAFVYTNIIEPEVVDDKRLRLLEIMPIRSVADGKLDLIEFSNTHYKTLDVDTLSDIKILIATAYGTPVPFRYGPATVQLHFRRRRVL